MILRLLQRAGALMSGQTTASRQRAEKRLLFVCTGNICRSPTAEAVMRRQLSAAGLQGRIEVASAGTHALRGSAADARAVRAAAGRGYDMARLRARQFVRQDFAQFDHILVMDQDHIDWLRRDQPAAHAPRVELLMNFARQTPGVSEVPDPYYGPPQGFEEALNLIEDACAGLLETLRATPVVSGQLPRG